ncbi:MAG: bifunctional diaminohydroxyphosphoribosylaminopyrimidine deaminase/5-amino-6-(5-phosphoribosylamino)uracil reductase RibD [Planctomycetales bacterium]|nr:bifunctional diaminohydroxyphosphoribosylaminopyrimidine deaminase/5-amino-6-(5-phosphoribosylamino)uracil reductase RibD [Planctomycetales bacterium]MCA9180775.1 bifunctional diaminohydroxyphosphoribosylaminopyrimidine deaminase/5-amino-6-(5-phosphoribosylamino)uracil reductase RibD [Planctomycetales bacterium]
MATGLVNQWMQRALALAARGEGYVEPNPLVGCVLVGGASGNGANDEVLLGEGYHARFGQAHAERAALEDARQRGHAARLVGATAYVTLEPCCHHGKTPPCTAALIEAGIARVVTAQLDPFAQVAGQGVAALRAAGVSVEVGVEQAAAEQLLAPYLKRLSHGRPWVIAKWAMSLDGKLATHAGQSQWISCETSRARVQELRGRVDAIVVGSRTALADNPRLTARTPHAPPRAALRVVLDSQLQLPLNSQLVRTAREIPVLLVAGPDASADKAEQLRELGCQVHLSPHADRQLRLDSLLQHLARHYEATNVLVEGGGELLGSLLELRQIDQCEVFIAPKLIGGHAAPSPIGGIGLAELNDGPAATSWQVEPSGQDSHIRMRLNWEKTNTSR